MNPKEEYNKLLKRFNNAEEYLNNKEIPLKDRLKWEGEFMLIVNTLADLVNSIGGMTKDEMLNGFKL